MPNSGARARRRYTIAVVALLVALVAGGSYLRVRFLHGVMMSTWEKVLEGGAVTTMTTVDDWYAERAADVDGLAATVAIHATMGLPGTNGVPSYETLLAPITRRAKFAEVWIVDDSGGVIASARGAALLGQERSTAVRSIRQGRTLHSAIIPVGPHAAWLTIAAPVRVSRSESGPGRVPRAVVFRTDVAAAFAPWAVGRANAALSLFSTPIPGGVIAISVCPEQRPSVCITEVMNPPPTSPLAMALARKDTFGVFRIPDGRSVFAATRYDRALGWGVVRRVFDVDAVVPMQKELAIEGAFLAALLALAGLGGYAANRTVRVRRLDEQRKATQRLATVVDASTDGIISLDADFRITMVNGAVERMLGRPRAQLVGTAVFDLFAPEWRSVLTQSLQAFSRSEAADAPLTDTERCAALRADGSPVPVDARISRAVFDEDPLYVMGLRDVSDRARSERFLEGQRHVLELIASGAPAQGTLAGLLDMLSAEAPALQCAVYELDEERQVAQIVAAPALPPAFVAAVHDAPVGPDASGIVGTAIHRGESILSSDVLRDPLLRTSLPTLLAHDFLASFAIPLRAVDGRIIGALAGFYEEARELTPPERELVRAAVHLASIALASGRDAALLRASEASFRSFVENAPAAIFRETHRGVLVSANSAMLALLGHSSLAELASAARQGRLYQDPGARAELLRVLAAEDVVRGVELEWRRADDSLVTVRVSARASRDERGELRGWEGYAEDVTSLRAAEGALRRSERLAAVGQLISGVAHELNNPLSSIMHFAEDLLTDDRSVADAEALGVIRDQARRSRAIVRDLLSFVRQRAASTAPVPLAEVVALTARGMRPSLEATGVTLHLIETADHSCVLADRAGIEQIVVNLVSNAAQAAGSGGEIWVRTERTSTGCLLAVEDSGPGVPHDILPRIFDPFFTTKPTGEGTGLGLSVTLGIVEQFGGRIAVDPRAGGSGSRFSVFLPVTEGKPAADPARRVGARGALRPTPAEVAPLPVVTAGGGPAGACLRYAEGQWRKVGGDVALSASAIVSIPALPCGETLTFLRTAR